MYDEFRLNILRELACAGIEDDTMRRVIEIVDRVGTEYDVSRRETAIVPIEMTAQYTLMEFLACKSLEGLSKGTLYNYHTTLMRFLCSMKKKFDDIEPNDIRLYLCQYQRVNNISNRTLDKIRTNISGFFRWALAEGKIARDPSLAIHPIKFTVTPRTSLSQLELEYVRKVCGDIREKAIIELLYSTGCRVSELCGMKKCDVDWANRTIQVLGKGSKYRTVFINAKAYVTLVDYLSTRTDGDDHLIVSDRKPHGGLTRYAVEHIVSEISDRAHRFTGKRITPHVFRHTTATQALAHGMPIQNISKMLGHSQVETTMIYAEINTADVQHDHTRYII